MVLDTDLSKHFMIIKKFESSLGKEGEESDQPTFDMEKEQNRLIVLGVALKCAGNYIFG